MTGKEISISDKIDYLFGYENGKIVEAQMKTYGTCRR